MAVVEDQIIAETSPQSSNSVPFSFWQSRDVSEFCEQFGVPRKPGMALRVATGRRYCRASVLQGALMHATGSAVRGF